MNDNQIEILMATYNSARFLAAQLDSILSQTYSHFKLIIRDDASTDETASILQNYQKRYPQKIQLLLKKENLGAKGNFAHLMSLSKADYIFFSDGDDVWLPQKIEKSLAQMNKAEEEYGSHTPLLIHTDLNVVDRNLKLISPSFWTYAQLSPEAFSLNRLLVQNNVTGCTMLINRALLKKSSPIPAQAIMHDWWIACTAAAFGHIIPIHESTILYRQHGKNEIGAKEAANWKKPSIYIKELKQLHKIGIRKKIRASLSNTLLQAASFWERYHTELSLAQARIARDYSMLQSYTFFKRRILILQHGFFKSSLLKTMAMLVFI